MTDLVLNEYLRGNINGIIWEEELYSRINNPLCLERYGFKVYSQNDEDGIIEEIFTRIGSKSKKFVEFGVQNGIESNGHYLLLKDWNGLWIECDNACYDQIMEKFQGVIINKQLLVAKEFITKDNINTILVNNGMTGEIDLLSIDVDGNDYHIWKAIKEVNPRVVVIEYNAKIPPSCEWVMPYCEQHRWDGGDKHGASLLALDKLGKEKGYILVGTNISGVNAFFVRNDCAGNNFVPMPVKKLYNPPRFYKEFYTGHPSLYCLKDIPEGRMQLFYGTSDNILFYQGFHNQEMPGDIKRWMAQKEATVFIRDCNNDISRIVVHWENPIIIYNAGEAPKKIKIKIEDGSYIEKELTNNEEDLELEVKREKCTNDGILEVKIQIDDVWCPKMLGVGEDTRMLGLLISKKVGCLK